MNDGGPSFPVITGSDGGALNAGMSLRDYFAAAALTGLAAATDPEGTWVYGDGMTVAEVAYDIADAMLEKRSKG